MERLFVAGPPVRGDLFYGRKDLLQSVSLGNNYALVGLRRVGKTSITLELASKFQKQGDIPVVISLFEISPFTIENFLKRYALAITKAYLKDAGMTKRIESFLGGQKEGFVEFLKNVKISISLQEVVSLWFEYNDKKKDYTEAIEKTILFPERLAKEKNVRFVIFIDEFQESRHLGILNALRENMQKTEHVTYVVSGSAVGLMSQILGSKKSPFYGFFLQKQVKGLDKESAQKLLSRSKKMGITIEPGIVEKVIERTKAYPLYLQAFGHAAVDIALSKGVKKVDDTLYKECWGRMYEELYFHFEYLESEIKGKKKAIVEAIALRNARSVSEISKATAIPLNALGTYMNRLVREGILEKDKASYLLADPVFEDWLRDKQ